MKEKNTEDKGKIIAPVSSDESFDDRVKRISELVKKVLKVYKELQQNKIRH